MNVDTLEKLRNVATLIEKFRNLELKEKEWLLELFSAGQSVVLTMTILDAKVAPRTASQILNAVAEAGVAVQMNKKKAYAPTGRPRKLVQKESISQTSRAS